MSESIRWMRSLLLCPRHHAHRQPRGSCNEAMKIPVEALHEFTDYFALPLHAEERLGIWSQ